MVRFKVSSNTSSLDLPPVANAIGSASISDDSLAVVPSNNTGVVSTSASQFSDLSNQIRYQLHRGFALLEAERQSLREERIETYNANRDLRAAVNYITAGNKIAFA
jgi:hypothetical protein